jgi:hypothetical protein
MQSLPADATGSWFVLKIAVAFSPVLAFAIVDVFGWFLRRKLSRRTEVAPPSGRWPAPDESAGVAAPQGEAPEGMPNLSVSP